MNCPTDGTTLLMSERNGIEIDYCPQCRGVWLDRGELDKILERARAESGPEVAQSQAQPQPYQQADPRRSYEPRYDERRGSRYESNRDDRYGDPRYRKKKSPFEFLGDIFD